MIKEMELNNLFKWPQLLKIIYYKPLSMADLDLKISII